MFSLIEIKKTHILTKVWPCNIFHWPTLYIAIYIYAIKVKLMQIIRKITF